MHSQFKTVNIYFITLKSNPNWFGIGETKGPCMMESHGIPRKGSDYGKAKQLLAANNDEYLLLQRWNNVSTRSDRDDHHDDILHEFVNTLPGVIQKGRESFEILATSPLSPDIIIDMIHEKFFAEKTEEKPRLKLRKHQKEFLEKINSTWESWKEFLLFAKCRSGKSIMSLYHVLEKGYKVTLIVSRYTSPIQSWRDDLKKYADFDNLAFINLADKNWKEQLEYWMSTDKQIILWTTIQGENRWKKIDCKVDFMIYDEAHVGYGSTQWKSMRKKFNCRTLYVTGTAYDIVDEFSTNNRFIYSYFEEQLDAKLGIIKAPKMRVILVKYDCDGYKKVYGDDPDAMKNLFSVNGDGEFVEPSLVRGFYVDYFGRQRHLRPQDRLLKNAKHIFMTLPSVVACHNSVPYLEATDFAPLVVTGDTDRDADAIKKHIADHPEGTIILTVKANVLGVTIREIDTVINCSEGESMNFWSQFAFRGGSSDRDWDVIDFCPKRCLTSLRKAFAAACDNDPRLVDYVMQDFAALTEWTEAFTEMSQEQLVEILSSDVGDSVRFLSSIVSSLNLEDLKNLEIGLDFTASKSKNTKKVVNDNPANGKSNKKMVFLDDLEKEASDKETDKKVETIKAIVERIPLVIFHCIRDRKIPNSIHSILNSEHYVHDTMDTEGVLENLVTQNYLNSKTLTYRINQVSIDFQHKMKKDECGTLEELSCSRQSQKSMPIELMDQLLSDVF